MKKTILLARPHPFIVNEMKPMLLEAGFDIQGVTDEAALANCKPADCAAAVISLAVYSPVSQSPTQVLAYLKQNGFSGKIVFAGLIPFEKVENNLQQFLSEAGWRIDVQALISPRSHDGSAVYIQQSDLAPAQAQASRKFLTTWI